MKYFSLVTPFLFTLSSVLYVHYGALLLIPPEQLLRPITALFLLLCLLTLPVYGITRSWEWASVLLTLFVFGFLSSHSFFNLAASIVVTVTLVWQLYFYYRRFKRTLHQFLILLNVAALLLIAFTLYLTLQSFVKVPWMTYRDSIHKTRNYSLETLTPPSTKPDIYYIVLDGYLRSDMLEALYGYDNAEFTGYLDRSGFVLPQVHSNYAKTAVSIPSTLNMDYVDSFAPGLEDSYFWWLMTPFIDHSRLRSVLEDQGYMTISMGTDWSLTDNPTTDLYLQPFPVLLTDYESYFLGETALGMTRPLIKAFAPVSTFDSHRQIILHSFEALQHVPEILRPKFIFAHIMAPHPPFVFDADGRPINPPGPFNINDANDFYGSREVYQEGYRGQVEFVNSQMRRVIDAILEKSATPPIIVIQADHGSGLLTDFSSAENTCIKERFSPFAAYYLPGVDPGRIPKDLTSVNLFRIVLNEYFETNLPLLENRNYYYEDTVYLYRLVDVTSRVDETCSIP